MPVTRRQFLKATALGLGVLSAETAGTGSIVRPDQEALAQEPLVPNSLEVIERLGKLEYVPMTEDALYHRYATQIHIPEPEVVRLTATGVEDPLRSIDNETVGEYGVYNPVGLDLGVEGADSDVARAAALVFRPNPEADRSKYDSERNILWDPEHDTIGKDMTNDLNVAPDLYNLESQDSNAMWFRGSGNVEVAARRPDGITVVLQGDVNNNMFGEGATISIVSPNGEVIDYQDIEGNPATFQIAKFGYEEDANALYLTNFLDEIRVGMTAKKEDNLWIHVGGPTSYFDTDGAGTQDFLDAGVAMLDQDAVRFGGGPEPRTIAVSK